MTPSDTYCLGDENLHALDAMTDNLENWIESVDYNFIESNHVPPRLFTRNSKVNAIIRHFFRMNPVNLRSRNDIIEASKIYTPQTLVALLKAYNELGEKEVCAMLLDRIMTLRSPKTKNFALKQGIRISMTMYENSEDDPTPLNTVWFGEYLLNDRLGTVDDTSKRNLILSICNYLIDELGYADYGEHGIYFYYGPTLKKIIYNASALISAFLIEAGVRYGVQRYVTLGQRGIRFIVNSQNADGSWYYAAAPERPVIDCFHQSYILQALHRARPHISLNVDDAISKGEKYYRTFFKFRKNLVIPSRYDKRLTPNKTWILVKYDGRDISEGIIYFSRFSHDPILVNGLFNLLKENVRPAGWILPEYFKYGPGKIPYMEFEAWYLYTLASLRNTCVR